MATSRLRYLWVLVGGICWAHGVTAQDGSPDRDDLTEPVYRVTSKVNPAADLATPAATAAADANLPATAPPGPGHPLDPAIQFAAQMKERIERDIRDYTCLLVKRERVGERLLDPEYIRVKIRHRHIGEDKVAVPFSVYLKFVKPTGMKGREVIYVDGQNSGRLVAHEGGWKGRLCPTVTLVPTSGLAMQGNRYPITEIGLLTLTDRLIERGQGERKHGECEVQFIRGAKVDNRPCTRLLVRHPQKRPHFDFHTASIYVDDEYNVPVRYEAHEWPENEGDEPRLIEEYTYVDLKFNVGLSDADFDRANSSYNF